MDTRAHWKRSPRPQCGLALLCVVFCLLPGCQQLTRQPAEPTGDAELAALAARLSAAGEPNELGVSAPKTEPVVAVKPAPTPPTASAKTETAAPAVKKTESPAPAAAQNAETVAPAAVQKVETAAKRTEPTPATAPAPVPPAKAEASAAAPAPAAKPAQTPAPAASIGPETIETTPVPEAAEPKADAASKLTEGEGVGGGKREVVISEPAPMKPLSFTPAAPPVALDTVPLAAANPTVDLTLAPTASPETAAEGTSETEGQRSVFRGLLGYGRSALGYAADHYIMLGSVAIAAPALFVFVRKRRFFVRAFRKMNLDD